MSSNYAERIIAVVNHLLANARSQQIDGKTVRFCMDSDVDYGAVWIIQRSRLIPKSKLSEVFDQLLAGGPSWIHGNLVATNESLPLLTIRVGENVGNPNPSINASVEIDKVVEIIDP